MHYSKRTTALLSLFLALCVSCKKEIIAPSSLTNNQLKFSTINQKSSFASTSVISNLINTGTTTYQLRILDTGVNYYTDRVYKITSLPSYLNNVQFIQTANNDKINTSDPMLSFDLSQPATVYIGYDSRANSIPTWLNSWQKSSDNIGVDDKAATLDIYRKTFEAGTVTIGGNIATPASGVLCQYIVMATLRDSTVTPPIVDNSFKLGINGHSLGLETYRSVPVAQQIAMLKKMGMNFYRQDILYRSDGTISTASPSDFKNLWKAANAAGVQILPVLYTKTLDWNKSESDNYTAGKLAGHNFAVKNSQYFKYYELGNELDKQTLISGNGDFLNDYNVNNVYTTAAYLKGMDEGIKSIQPNAKTMINAGWKHFAFLKAMEAYGVNFDIIAYHWYSDMEGASARNFPDITQKLSSMFTKPIWFTEVGQRFKNVDNIDQLQSNFTTAFINKCKANPQVKALLLYELMDEPGRDDREAHFGFVQWLTPYTNWSYKTVAQTLAGN